MLKVLKDLSGKISEVGDLEVAKDLAEIYETLTSRAATLSRKYWSLVVFLVYAQWTQLQILVCLKRRLSLLW